VTEEPTRRRALACLGAGFAVGLAGCSGGGGGTTDDGDESGDGDEATSEPAADTTTGTGETTDGQSGSMATESIATAAEGAKALTLKLLGNSDYESEVLTVESLTFVAASADAESPTIEVGETADVSEGEYQDAVVVADDLKVPYGTYESVEMTVTVEEVVDSSGSSVDVSGGTVSRTFMELDDEPNTVEESRFDATLTLYLSIRSGQLEVTGYSATALG